MPIQNQQHVIEENNNGSQNHRGTTKHSIEEKRNTVRS
jgi:hypothetical protein